MKPGFGSCLPILYEQWQLQLLEWELQQWGVACRAVGVHRTLMERKPEPSLKLAKHRNHQAGKMWAGPGGEGGERSQGVGF